jgi:hypothetical protein
MKQERRGFRFLFDARAEVAPEGAPSKTVLARVTELSLNGCYIQTAAPFPADAPIWVKNFHEGALRSQSQSRPCRSGVGYGRDVSRHQAILSKRFAKVDSFSNTKSN